MRCAGIVFRHRTAKTFALAFPFLPQASHSKSTPTHPYLCIYFVYSLSSASSLVRITCRRDRGSTPAPVGFRPCLGFAQLRFCRVCLPFRVLRAPCWTLASRGPKNYFVQDPNRLSGPQSYPYSSWGTSGTSSITCDNCQLASSREHWARVRNLIRKMITAYRNWVQRAHLPSHTEPRWSSSSKRLSPPE